MKYNYNLKQHYVPYITVKLHFKIYLIPVKERTAFIRNRLFSCNSVKVFTFNKNVSMLKKRESIIFLKNKQKKTY